MAQSGSTPIQLYYSTTPSAVPSASDLLPGELGLNIADGKLYYENASGVVQQLAGLSGFSGVSGASGVSGFSGANGASGVSGFSGAGGGSGASGTSGASGVSGFSGVNATGVSGFSGVSGYSGVSGSGVSGASGTSGFSGYSGANPGASGTSGFSGASGKSGYSGVSGFSGASGTSGFSGFSGYSGANPGASGTSGFSGASGYSGVSGYSGATGTGTSGYSGYSGASNPTITDDTTTNATMYPVWVAGTSGAQAAKVSSTKMTFNPNTGDLSLYGLRVQNKRAFFQGGTINSTGSGVEVGKVGSAGVINPFDRDANQYIPLQIYGNVISLYPSTATPGGGTTTVNLYGGLNFQGSTSGYTQLVAAATAGSASFTLPTADGTSGQFIKTDGSGNLSFGSASSGTSGFSGVSGYSGYSGATGTGTSGFSGISGYSGAAGAATPGGSNTQVQFNDSGAFGGNANLTFDKSTNALSLTGKLNLTAATGNYNVVTNSASASNPTTTIYQAFTRTATPTGAATTTYLAGRTFYVKDQSGFEVIGVTEYVSTFTSSGATTNQSTTYRLDNYAEVSGASFNSSFVEQNATSYYFGFSSGGTSSATKRFVINYNDIEPYTDGSMNIGTSFVRWGTVYAVTGTINTSDINEKEQIQPLEDAEKAVALSIKGLIKKFKWKTSVSEKGDAARIHVGVMAQEVRDAFVAQGLDPERYALFCKDVWWDREEVVRHDESENPITEIKHYTQEVEGGIRHERYGVRYDQLLVFMIAAF